MRKKQYKFLGALLLAFWGFAGTHQAKAQTTTAPKETGSRQAKVKIFKKEDGQYFLLDTTLTLTEGQDLEQTIKNWQIEKGNLRQLGAKAVEQSNLAGGEIKVFKYSGPQGKDSLRTVLFRSMVADSLLTHLRGVEVKKAVEHIELLRDKDGGHPISFRRLIQGDSLLKGHRIFLRDTTFTLLADTFTRKETIRVEKDGKTGEVKVFRKLGNHAEELLETGDYEMTKIKSPGQQIIIIKSMKPAAGPHMKSEAAPQKSKSKKETAPALNLQVFPNPTSGRVSLSFQSPKKAKAQLRVVNSLGQTVLQKDLGTVQGVISQEFDLIPYGKGVYNLQLQVGATAASSKVLVE